MGGVFKKERSRGSFDSTSNAKQISCALDSTSGGVFVCVFVRAFLCVSMYFWEIRVGVRI